MVVRLEFIAYTSKPVDAVVEINGEHLIYEQMNIKPLVGRTAAERPEEADYIYSNSEIALLNPNRAFASNNAKARFIAYGDEYLGAPAKISRLTNKKGRKIRPLLKAFGWF